eukprot:SAG31_NODE_249_length_19118_cov_47.456195_27_plen_200_part_00
MRTWEIQQEKSHKNEKVTVLTSPPPAAATASQTCARGFGRTCAVPNCKTGAPEVSEIIGKFGAPNCKTGAPEVSEIVGKFGASRIGAVRNNSAAHRIAASERGVRGAVDQRAATLTVLQQRALGVPFAPADCTAPNKSEGHVANTLGAKAETMGPDGGGKLVVTNAWKTHMLRRTGVCRRRRFRRRSWARSPPMSPTQP